LPVTALGIAVGVAVWAMPVDARVRLATDARATPRFAFLRYRPGAQRRRIEGALG
jgi:hypothetical protein